jgi:hypothetical protein
VCHQVVNLSYAHELSCRSRQRPGNPLGLKQPDVSDLLRGKLARFSRERLERFLNALDLEVRIQIGPRPRWKRHAGISVEVVGSF